MEESLMDDEMNQANSPPSPAASMRPHIISTQTAGEIRFPGSPAGTKPGKRGEWVGGGTGRGPITSPSQMASVYQGVIRIIVPVVSASLARV